MKTKHLFMGFFLMILCFFVLPETVSAENAPTTLHINGENIIAKEDYTVTCGSGFAVYDPATATLTLNNAYIDKSVSKITYGAIDTVGSDCHLTICLVGNNTISTSRSGIQSTNGSITFSGTGKLDVTPRGTENCIIAGGDITIDGPELILNSGYRGIASGGKVTLCNGAKVTSNWNQYGIDSISDLIIKENSTVNAIAEKEQANAIISGGDITVQDSSINASGGYAAIFAHLNISISNSTISTNTRESGYGIYALNGSMLIEKGSKVDAKAGYGLYAATTLTIDNSNVKAESTNTSFAGIWSESTLKITGNSDVVSTGKIGSATGSFTISPAQDKMIEVKTGTSENTAAHLQNSPFETETVLSNVTDSYYHSKPHVHSGGTATCIQKAVCSDCGKEYGELAAHKYSTVWKSDKTSHWHVCTVCGDVKDKAAHTEDSGTVTKAATEVSTGVKTYKCKVCGVVTRTETIAKLPAQTQLVLPWVTAGQKSATVYWPKVKGASGYYIYAAQCNTASKTYTLKKVKEVKSGAAGSYKITGLKNSTWYKYQVVAYKTVSGKKITLGKSLVLHSITAGNKTYGNVAKVLTSKKAVSLQKGKTAKLSGTLVMSKNKKLKTHVAKIRYAVSDSSVVSVTASGTVKGLKKGSCTVYLISQNGARTSVKVTVK